MWEQIYEVLATLSPVAVKLCGSIQLNSYMLVYSFSYAKNQGFKLTFNQCLGPTLW